MTEEQRKQLTLQITIVRTLSYAIALLKALNADPDLLGEIVDNSDYIINEFTTSNLL